jgi:hypothetical protein
LAKRTPRGRGSPYTSKRRDIIKAIPGLKLPAPTTRQRKAQLSTLHRYLFGGKTRAGVRHYGVLNQPHKLVTVKSARQRRELVSKLRLDTPDFKAIDRLLGKRLVTPQTQNWKIVRGQAVRDTKYQRYTETEVNRKLAARDPLTAAQQALNAAQFNRERRAVVVFRIGSHTTRSTADLGVAAQEFERLYNKYPEIRDFLSMEIVQNKRQIRRSLFEEIVKEKERQREHYKSALKPKPQRKPKAKPKTKRLRGKSSQKKNRRHRR